MSLYTRQALASFAKDSVIDRFDYDSDDLVIMLDDTGILPMSDASPVFGMGGIVVTGAEYRDLSDRWRQFKRNRLGIVDGPAHADDYFNDGDTQRVLEVAAFLQGLGEIFIACMVQQTTEFIHTTPIYAVSGGLTQQLNTYPVQSVPRKARVLIEYSERIFQEIGELMVVYEKPTTAGWALDFMKKEHCEPGLEVADLVMNLLGRHHRRKLKGRPGYEAILAPIFRNRRFLQLRMWRKAEFKLPAGAPGLAKPVSITKARRDAPLGPNGEKHLLDIKFELIPVDSSQDGKPQGKTDAQKAAKE